MISFHSIFKMSFGALRRNKTRSALTCSGICIGIAAVIAVLAIGRGATKVVEEEITSSGKNLMNIQPEYRRKGAVSLGASQGQRMTLRDVMAIEDQLGHIIYAATPSVGVKRQVIYKNENWYTSISCDTEKYPELHKWPVGEGRFFTKEELQSSARVCVLGSTVYEHLFPLGENPVGVTIRIGTMPFRVIGVLSSKGVNAWGGDQDDWITMPYTTFERYVYRSKMRAIGGVVVSLYDEDDTEEAKREVTALLRQRHRLKDFEDDDFVVRDQKEIMAVKTAVTSRMTVLLSAIAVISLLVGGVGVMNIMLVSVSERIREIGLRIAIGATPFSVLMQFIIEAATISSFGGVLGVACGVGLAHAIGMWRGWPIAIETTSTIGVFLLSCALGVFFGFYPAKRASKLNPIQCLRHE